MKKILRKAKRGFLETLQLNGQTTKLVTWEASWYWDSADAESVKYNSPELPVFGQPWVLIPPKPRTLKGFHSGSSAFILCDPFRVKILLLAIPG